jgi:hypothetical protein
MAKVQNVSAPRNRTVGARGFTQHGPMGIPVPVTVRGQKSVSALVSPDDYHRTSQHKWRLDKSSGYAVRNMSASERIGSGFRGHANTKVFMHVENFFHGYQQSGGKIPRGFSHPLSPYHMTGPRGGTLKKKLFAVDHANNNRLDNTRRNTRLLTWAENAMNRINTSGYRGVTKAKGGYKAVMQYNGKRIATKTMPTKEHAALGYNKMLKKHKVKYGKPNVFGTAPSRKVHAEVNAAMSKRKKKAASKKTTRQRTALAKAPSKVGTFVSVKAAVVRSKRTGKSTMRKRHRMRVGKKGHGVGHHVHR